jgi:hypothetical protein
MTPNDCLTVAIWKNLIKVVITHHPPQHLLSRRHEAARRFLQKQIGLSKQWDEPMPLRQEVTGTG